MGQPAHGRRSAIGAPLPVGTFLLTRVLCQSPWVGPRPSLLASAYVAWRSRLLRERSWRRVVLGSAWPAKSWTSRKGTPALRAAVMALWRKAVGAESVGGWKLCPAGQPAYQAPGRGLSHASPSAVQEDRPGGPVADVGLQRPRRSRGKGFGAALTALASESRLRSGAADRAEAAQQPLSRATTPPRSNTPGSPPESDRRCTRSFDTGIGGLPISGLSSSSPASGRNQWRTGQSRRFQSDLRK